MKIALITDTHFGCRNDNRFIIDHFEKFYNEVFFPYLEQNNINTVIHLGDLVDRRKYININTAHRMRTMFLDRLIGYDVHFIAGNHDEYFKNNSNVNVLNELVVGHGFNVYSKASEVVFDDMKILFVPWICADNEQHALEMIEKTNSQICFGHLQLQGFEMNKGQYCEHGQQASVFNKFDVVCSGHFHMKSSYQNINYLGTPYQQTWADFGQTKGFHIFDTETRSLTIVENPNHLFCKAYYDDKDFTFDQIVTDVDYSQYTGKYVKVIVKNKNNPYWYDQYIENIENHEAIDVQSVEDHLNISLQADASLVDSAVTTLDILNNSVDDYDVREEHKAPLTSLLQDLYQQALMVEN